MISVYVSKNAGTYSIVLSGISSKSFCANILKTFRYNIVKHINEAISAVCYDIAQDQLDTLKEIKAADERLKELP